MSEKRKKIWIDRFQTYLSLRIAFYFILYQVAVWSLFVIERNLFATMGQLGSPFGSVYLFLVVAVITLGVLFIYDAMKLTHRIVGPLYRFRKTIQALTAGEEVELMTLRQGDFLLELRDDLNELLRVLEQRGVIVIKTAAVKQGQEQKQPAPLSSVPSAS